MLYLPWRNDTNDTDGIDYKSVYASNLDLITQNRQLFEGRDQSSIDEAINILEELDPDELNFDGFAIEEIQNNEGAVVCRSLNQFQRTVFLHTLHCFKTLKQLPMYLYIGGGAGVGKSTVIRVLYEGLVRYMNSLPGALFTKLLKLKLNLN